MENNSANQSILAQDELPLIKEEAFNHEDLGIIWLNYPHTHETNYLTGTFGDLNGINNNFKSFNDADECIDYITSIPSNIHVFLILSCYQFIIPLIHLLPQIKSIYIFNINHTNNDENSYIKYSKVINIFNDRKLLGNKLLEDVKMFSKQLSAPMTFFNNTKEKSLKDLSKEGQYFMYMRLFIEILLRDSELDKAKYDLLEKCRHCYHDNQAELKKIDKFQNEYNSSETLRWYTNDSFLYRLLNKALRYQDFDIIYKFRYIIKQLHEQLKDLYTAQSSELMKIERVFRGQLMNKNELGSLQQNQGGLVSMNSFLSTTLDRNAALFYISGAEEGEFVPVLFEINTNSTNSMSTPYANIEKYSTITDEREILFSMDCVFQINSIEKDTENEQIYLIKLTITNQYEEVNGLKHLTDHIRTKTVDERFCLSALGYLMMKMGHYDKAKHYYELLIKDLPPYDSLTANLHNNIGLVHQHQGNYIEALKSMEKALNIHLETLPKNHLDIAITYSNIGLVYGYQGNCVGALNSYQIALDVQLQYLPEDHPDVATMHDNIGSVYQSQGNYTEALEFLKKSLDIKLKSLPEYHPDVATTYNNIGAVLQHQGIYDEALNFYEKARDVQLKSLPEDHPDIASTYNNIGAVHQSQDNYTVALDFYKKARDAQLKSLSEYHPDIGTTYNNLALVHQSQGNYDKAMNYFKKALDIKLKTLGENHLDIATMYNNIGLNYKCQENYVESMDYYEKTINIRLKHLSKDHPYIATIYNNIAVVHQNQGNYTEALNYYEETVNILLKSLPESHPDIAKVYNNIAKLHQSQDNYAQARNYFERALDIKLKTLGGNHPHVASIYCNIASTHESQGNNIEAMKYCEKVFTIQLATFLENLPDITRTDNNIGEAQQTQDNYAKALSCCDKILCIQLTTLSTDRNIAKTYNSIGYIYKRQGNFFTAMQYYVKTLEIQSKSLPKNDPDIVRTYWNIGNLYSCSGNGVQALIEWQKALDIALTSLPSTHPIIIGLRTKLSSVRDNT